MAQGKIKKVGLIIPQGDLVNHDLWKYLHQNLVNQITGKARIQLDSGKLVEIDVSIKYILTKDQFPFFINKRQNVMNMFIDPQQRERMTQMIDSAHKIYLKLPDNANLLVGNIVSSPNRTPLVILYFPVINQYMYSIIDTNTQSLLDEYKSTLN